MISKTSRLSSKDAMGGDVADGGPRRRCSRRPEASGDVGGWQQQCSSGIPVKERLAEQGSTDRRRRGVGDGETLGHRLRLSRSEAEEAWSAHTRPRAMVRSEGVGKC